MKDSQPKKTKKVNNQSIYFGLILCAGIICLLLLNFNLSSAISSIAVKEGSFAFSPASYPSLSNQLPVDISAEGVAVLDSDSHVFVFSRNPTRFFSPASTTKILTALVALDNFKLTDLLTIKSDDIEGSTIGLKKGEQLTLENLLYAMMLPSSNEAAVAIAENFPGGKESFVAEMNMKAKELGLSSTHLEDPVGLMDEANITTPRDLAILGEIAMKDHEVVKIVGTKTKTIESVGGRIFNLSNLNALLGRNGIEGVKTGFTETSGEVLVTSRVKDGKRILIVVMQSEDRFGDTLKIIENIDRNLIYLASQP